MKKIILISLICLLYNSTIQAQTEPSLLLKHKMDYFGNNNTKAFTDLEIFADEITKSNIKNTKAVLWNWDTIITFYDSLYWHRYTQTFDNFGNVLEYRIDRQENNVWSNNLKSTYFYNSNGKLSGRLDEEWLYAMPVWLNVYRFSINYDANTGLLSDIVRENWVQNSWENNTKVNSIYNSNNQLISLVFLNWHNSSWDTMHRYIYNYDTNGNKIIDNHDTYDSSLQTWKADIKNSIIYDSINKIKSVVSLNFQNPMLSNDSSLYYYDSIGKLQSIYIYKGVNSFYWNLSDLIEYTYDSNGFLLQMKRSVLNNSVWNDYYADIYTNDLNGNILTHFMNPITLPNDKNKLSYSYDVNNNSVSGKVERLINNNWISDPYQTCLEIFSNRASIFKIPINSSSYVAHFKSFTTGINENKANTEFNIYPNPAYDIINITQSDNKIKELKVFNFQGKQIINKVKSTNENNIVISINNLSKGIYFLQLDTDKGIVNKKFIVIK